MGSEGRQGEQVGSGGDPERDELIQKLFAQYDANGNGRLERSEIPALISDLSASLGLEMDESQADLLLGMLDVDEDGAIDLEEFKVLFFQQQEPNVDGEGIPGDADIQPL